MIPFDWVKSIELRKSFEAIASGQRPTQGNAISILKLFAKSALASGEPWAARTPVGVVDYYMARLDFNSSLAYFLNLSEAMGENERVHVLIDRNGSIHILANPLTTIALHKASESCRTIAIAYVNGGFLRKTKKGFSCGDTVYKMKSEVPPQQVGEDWWDPFETNLIVSSIIMKRLLIAAIPTLSVSNFINYGKIEFKNSGKHSPLWPFAAITTLAFNWKSLYAVDAFNCSELSVQRLKQLDVQVQRLPGPTCI
jgi:hypothetical protein